MLHEFHVFVLEQAYHAFFRVIEALDELNSSTLSGPTRTDEGCGLP